MQGFNKLFTLVLTITLLFLLAGCGSEEKKQESVSETVTQSTGNKLQIGILDNYAPFALREFGMLHQRHGDPSSSCDHILHTEQLIIN